jgi:CarD-like/TRCF domain
MLPKATGSQKQQNLMGNGVMATPMTAAMVSAALKATYSKINPADADPFRKGDAVVYSTYGLGRIDGVGFEDIVGYRLNLIHISFDENQRTLRVPVAQARAAGLRKLASRNELSDALVILKNRPRVSRLMWAKRAPKDIWRRSTPVISGRWLKSFAICRRPKRVPADASASAICSRQH